MKRFFYYLVNADDIVPSSMLSDRTRSTQSFFFFVTPYQRINH